MRHQVLGAAVVGGVLAGMTSCVSWRGESEGPPALTADMAADEVVEAGVRFGGRTLDAAGEWMTQRRAWNEAGPRLEALLHAEKETLPNAELVNAVRMYVQSPVRPKVDRVLRDLWVSDRSLGRQLGWQIAAQAPGPVVAKAVETEIERAVETNDESRILLPEFADAVRANRLSGAYSVLRLGLLTTGHLQFVTAMAELAPRKASDDFMEYLALAPVEELRQLTQTRVSVPTCLAIFAHMKKFPALASHGRFDFLFLYAVSRNQALAEAALATIQVYLPEYQSALALRLAHLPAWVQVSYVEAARRQTSPVMALFLAELQETTTQEEVIEEIGEKTPVRDL